MEIKLEFKVMINYPGSYFKPGDILVQSDKIPPFSVGKFINDTTGWAWINNPLDFPEVLKPLMEEYIEKTTDNK
jgi:hypothetical protein